MENEVEGTTSPAKEFLPLLEQKLKKLIEQREQVSSEIEETRKMIDEIKVKLSGGELPLPIGESVQKESSPLSLESVPHRFE
jgi:chaperonin cofactor prefoldin